MSQEELKTLDQQLAEMAQETPDMPEDFHSRWTEKIREEARKEENPAREEEKPVRKENRRQWRYILSTAAVFVFLIAGTLLTRNQDKKNSIPETMKSENLAAQVTALTEAGEALANGIGGTALYQKSGAQELSAPVDESAEEEAWEAPNYEEADLAEDAAVPEAAGYAAESAVLYDAMSMESAEEKEEPAATPEVTPEATPEVTEAPSPEPEKKGELGEETISFLKDMGSFALRVIPWLLGGAVLAFLAALIDRRIREKRNNK